VTRSSARITAVALLGVIAIATGIAALPSSLGSGPLPTVGPGATGIAIGSPDATPSARPSPTPSATPIPPPTPELSILEMPGIRERLQAAVDKGRATMAAPAIVASVLFADGSSWSGTSGVADLATKRALTVDTPFSIASVSKTFLSAEIMELVFAGKLHLDDSVARLLPKVLVGGRAIDPKITIRELLDHTSGLRDYLTDRKLDLAVQANPRRVWTPTEVLAYAGKPLAAPGTGYHYANTNYVLLGLIAEHMTGKTLAQEYRKRFFDPLGLRSATYQGVEKPVAKMPTAYRYKSVVLDSPPADITDGTDVRPFTAIITAAGAAGSVAASAPDLARWARALYGGDVLPAGALEAMVADATTTATLKPGYPYGLGVQVFTIDGRISYGHSGRLVGARSAVRWFPEAGVAIAVVTNESRFDPGFIARDLLAIVAPRLDWPGPPMR
jgi:D-alanyl-D-alanine carboxypeptidase